MTKNTTRAKASARLSLARQAGIAALFVVAAVLGLVTGILLAYGGDLPQVSALDEYTPSTITRVHATDGSVIAEFATQRRVLLTYEEIPEVLRQAILAAEDAEFESHIGLRPVRLFVTVVRNLVYRRQLLYAGASTLTQQLARKLFLKPEKTIERKIKEAILALQIERRYTKHEIFTLYCNQMNLGHGAYGVEAAARVYFGKSVKQLSLEEAALIAGILQLPERQSPYINRRWALQRRNYTLQRMALEHFITQAQADAAKAKPIVVAGLPSYGNSTAPYFAEEIRQHLERTYGARDLYESGLEVYSTLDADLQRAANRAMDTGLRQVDKRRGWRRKVRNVLAEHRSLDDVHEKRWSKPIAEGDIVPALVTELGGARTGRPAGGTADGAPPPSGAARLKIGTYQADLTRQSIRWTGRVSAADVVHVGDLIDVLVTAIDVEHNRLTVSLEQTPEIEGAILAIDTRTGQIKAMVGGFDFGRSKFNRAVQAPRQVGSTFKPFVFAAAIDRGFTPSTIIIDEPVAYNAGAGQPPYSPLNYDRKYEGPVTMRHVLEQSRNVPTVKMMEQLGAQQVCDYAKRMGFESPLQPYLSTALGASEATLIELTSAYSAFPNQGIRMVPYDITKVLDRDGSLLEEHRPQPRDAIRADTAFVMVNLLRGVVQRGTGAKAAELEWPLAGKTGTMDEYTDAWFVGFDPNITVGVWVGYNEKKPIGRNETGAQAALPIWMDVMKAYITLHGDRQNPPVFEAPGNIVFMTVDRATGAPVDPATPGAINEAYIAGTQPGVGFPRQ
jgi:penicillin-binding protein 1A